MGQVIKTGMFNNLKIKLKSIFKDIVNHDLLLSILVTVIVVIAGITIGYENNKVVPVNSDTVSHYNLSPSNRLSFMVDWDGPNYLMIAKSGYTDKIQANFFPLYPLIVRVFNSVIDSPVYSALLISWLSLVGAIYFYLKIIKEMYGVKRNSEALRGLLFFVLYPTGVFLIAAYTESLFAFLALGALYFVLKKRYTWAALLTLLCTATHVNGIFILVLLGLLMIEQRAKIGEIIKTLVIGSLGIIGYMVYLQVHFHDALEFLVAQGKHSSPDFRPLHVLSVIATRNGVFCLLLIISAVYWWRRRKSFSIYSILYACLVFESSHGTLSGFGRYSLMAFPLQFMLYEYFRDKKIGYSIALAVCAIGWAYFTLQYAGGYTGG
jgi:Gpi18-like mannosyltransferase